MITINIGGSLRINLTVAHLLSPEHIRSWLILNPNMANRQQLVHTPETYFNCGSNMNLHVSGSRRTTGETDAHV